MPIHTDTAGGQLKRVAEQISRTDDATRKQTCSRSFQAEREL